MPATRRTAILYHYYEADGRYRDNLFYFLGLTADLGHPVFIAASSPVPAEVSALPGVTIIPCPNHGYDFGGYGKVIAELGPRLDDFETFLFVNSSVRGPFLQIGQNADWTRLFTDRLQGDVALVGATACDMEIDYIYARMFQERHGKRDRLLHIQSTAYALSRAGLRQLQDVNFYAIPEAYEKHDIILDFEMRMTDLLLRGGAQAECLMPVFAGVDFRNPDAAPGIPRVSTSDFGNLIGWADFLGAQPSAYETLFTKVNIPEQDQVVLLAESLGNLRRNTRPAMADWPPIRDLGHRLTSEAESVACRHVAAQHHRYWRRYLRLVNRMKQIWRNHILPPPETK